MYKRVGSKLTLLYFFMMGNIIRYEKIEVSDMLGKLKNNNRGAFTLWQRGFLYVVLFCVFIFALDVCILALQILTTSHQLAYVAEKLSFQGGLVGANAPNSNYWTNEDIYNYFNRSMIRFGVDGKTCNWTLSVDGTEIINAKAGGVTKLNAVSGNKVSEGNISSNYASSSVITIWFQHKYFFSGNVFRFPSSTNGYYLTNKYQNLYING